MDYSSRRRSTCLDLNVNVASVPTGTFLVDELHRMTAENKKLTEMLIVMCENYNALQSHLLRKMTEKRQLSKNRKSDPKSIGSGLHETDATQTNAVDLVVEGKESNSSNKEILTSLGECSLDQNNERDQKQSGDCISEQLGGINLSNEYQNDERNQSQSEDCYGAQLGGVNLSHYYQSSDIDKIELCDNSDPGSLIREETSTSLVEDSFFPSTKPESSGRIWNGTNTIPDFTKELPILSLFPTDKSGIDTNSESKETPPRFNHYSNSIVSLFPPARSPDSSENYEITIPNPSIPSSFLPIISLFPTDKSGIDNNSESKETPPRFNHYSNSIVSLFPPARSPDSSENYEITIPNPSIPSSFPQVFPQPNGQAALSIPLHFPPTMSNTSSESNERPNGQTTLSIPLHFPPTMSNTSSESNETPNGQTTLSIPSHFPPIMSDTSSESNQTFNGNTNLSNPLLFPAYKSETETDDSSSSESNETFRTITSRQMVVQGSHLQPLLKQMMPQAQLSGNMQQAQAAQATNATSSASSASGYSLQMQQQLQLLQQQQLQLKTQIHNSFDRYMQQVQAAQSTNITSSNGMWSFYTPVLNNISTSGPQSRDDQTRR